VGGARFDCTALSHCRWANGLTRVSAASCSKESCFPNYKFGGGGGAETLVVSAAGCLRHVEHLIKCFWAVSHVSWLKVTDVSGTRSAITGLSVASETVVIFNQVTTLIMAQDFINVGRPERVRSY
jgi:hypothetical protein